MQITGLMTELGGPGASELGIKLDDGFVNRLLAYARSVSHFPTAVKEVRAASYLPGSLSGSYDKTSPPRCKAIASFPIRGLHYAKFLFIVLPTTI